MYVNNINQFSQNNQNVENLSRLHIQSNSTLNCWWFWYRGYLLRFLSFFPINKRHKNSFLNNITLTYMLLQLTISPNVTTSNAFPRVFPVVFFFQFRGSKFYSDLKLFTHSRQDLRLVFYLNTLNNNECYQNEHVCTERNSYMYQVHTFTEPIWPSSKSWFQ